MCKATKAIHLKLLRSLTSDAFISTLRRFITPTGNPIAIYSDNGSNFLAARDELAKLQNEMKSVIVNSHEALSSEGVEWHSPGVRTIKNQFF